MATEAEIIPEPIAIAKAEDDQLKKFHGGFNQPAETDEFGVDLLNTIPLGNPEISKGESFLISPETTKFASDNISVMLEQYDVDDVPSKAQKMNLDEGDSVRNEIRSGLTVGDDISYKDVNADEKSNNTKHEAYEEPKTISTGNDNDERIGKYDSVLPLQKLIEEDIEAKLKRDGEKGTEISKKFENSDRTDVIQAEENIRIIEQDVAKEETEAHKIEDDSKAENNFELSIPATDKEKDQENVEREPEIEVCKESETTVKENADKEEQPVVDVNDSSTISEGAEIESAKEDESSPVKLSEEAMGSNIEEAAEPKNDLGLAEVNIKETEAEEKRQEIDNAHAVENNSLVATEVPNVGNEDQMEMIKREILSQEIPEEEVEEQSITEGDSFLVSPQTSKVASQQLIEEERVEEEKLKEENTSEGIKEDSQDDEKGTERSEMFENADRTDNIQAEENISIIEQDESKEIYKDKTSIGEESPSITSESKADEIFPIKEEENVQNPEGTKEKITEDHDDNCTKYNMENEDQRKDDEESEACKNTGSIVLTETKSDEMEVETMTKGDGIEFNQKAESKNAVENIEDSLKQEDAEEVFKESERTEKENTDKEEQPISDSSISEATVNGRAKEDESSPLKLAEEAKDSNIAEIAESKNDPGPIVTEYKLKEETSVKGTGTDDSESASTAGEENTKEAEAEEKMQEIDNAPAAENNTLETNDDEQISKETADIDVKPMDSVSCQESKEINKDEDGLQDEIPNAGSEDQVEMTTRELVFQEIPEEPVNENFNLPSKEHQHLDEAVDLEEVSSRIKYGKENIQEEENLSENLEKPESLKEDDKAEKEETQLSSGIHDEMPEDANTNDNEKVFRESETTVSAAGEENPDKEEQPIVDFSDSSIREGTVNGSATEDESSQTKLAEKAIDSNIDETGEPKNDLILVFIEKKLEEDIAPTEIKEDSVYISSLEPEDSKNDVKEETLVKGRTGTDHLESASAAEEVEKANIKEAEAEEKWQEIDNAIADEKNSLATKEDEQISTEAADIDVKPIDSISCQESKEIPQDEGGLQNAVPNVRTEDQMELTTREILLQEIPVEEVQEHISNLPSEEYEPTPIEEREITDENSDKEQTPYEYSETSVSQEKQDILMENESQEIENEVNEKESGDKVKEDLVEEPEDIDVSKEEGTKETPIQNETCELKTVQEQSSDLGLEKGNADDANPSDEATDLEEISSTTKDCKKDIQEEENLSENLAKQESLKEDAEAEKEEAQSSTGVHDQIPEVCRETEPTALAAVEENPDGEERSIVDISKSVSEETVNKSTKEDESSPLKLAEEPENDPSPVFPELELKEGIALVEIKEKFFNSSSMEFRKDVKVESLLQESAGTDDLDSAAETEETNIKEAEAEEEKQEINNALAIEKNSLPTTEDEQIRIETADIAVKPMNSSMSCQENEEEEDPLQDKVPSEGNENKVEITSREFVLQEIPKEEVKEDSNLPSEEHQPITISQAMKITDETSEKDQTPYDYSETLVSQEKYEILKENEDNSTEDVPIPESLNKDVEEEKEEAGLPNDNEQNAEQVLESSEEKPTSDAEPADQETFPEASNSQADETSIHVQNQETEKHIKEEMEEKLIGKDYTDQVQDADEFTKGVILSEEAHKEVEKADDSEDIKEHIIEESSTKEFQPEQKENETTNEVEDYSSVSTECLNEAEPEEQKEAEVEENSTKEEESGGECLSVLEEENIEEISVKEARKETSLNNAEVHEEPVTKLSISSDKMSSETTESYANQETQQVENKQLEGVSSELEADITNRDSDAGYEPEDQIDEAIAENDIISHSTLPKENPDEQLQTSLSTFPSEDKEISTAHSNERTEEEMQNDAEVVKHESSESSSETKTAEEIPLPNEGEKEPNVISEVIEQDLQEEKSDEQVQNTSTTFLSEETGALSEETEDGKIIEEVPRTLAFGIGDEDGKTHLADKPEEMTTSSALLEKEEESMVEKIQEEKINEEEIQENNISEDSSDARKTEETCLEKEESRELENAKKDEIAAAQALQEERGYGTGALSEKAEKAEMTEDVPEKPDVLTEDEITVEQTLSADKIEEGATSSALLSNEQDEETLCIVEKTEEEKVNEEEISENKIPDNSSDANKMEETCLEKEEFQELEDAKKDDTASGQDAETIEQTLSADEPVEGTVSSALLSEEQDEEAMSIVERAEEEKINEEEISENRISDDSSDAKKTEEICLEKQEYKELEDAKKDEIAASMGLQVEDPKEESLTSSSAVPYEKLEPATTAKVNELEDEKVKELEILEKETCFTKEINQDPEAVLDQGTAVDHTSTAEKAPEIVTISIVKKLDEEKREGAEKLESENFEESLARETEEISSSKSFSEEQSDERLGISKYAITSEELELEKANKEEIMKDESTEDVSDARTTEEVCSQKEKSINLEAVAEDEITVVQALIEMRSEEQGENPILPSKEEECDSASTAENTESKEAKEAELLQDNGEDACLKKEQFLEDASDQVIPTEKIEEKVLDEYKQETFIEDDKIEEENIQSEDSDGANPVQEFQAELEDQTRASEVTVEESQEHGVSREEENKKEGTLEGDKTTPLEPAIELQGASEDGAPPAQALLGENQGDQLHVTTSTLPSEEQKDEIKENELQEDEMSEKELPTETENSAAKGNLVEDEVREEMRNEENQHEKENEGNETILNEVSTEEVLAENQVAQTSSSTFLSGELKIESGRELVEEKLVVKSQEPCEDEIVGQKIVYEALTISEDEITVGQALTEKRSEEQANNPTVLSKEEEYESTCIVEKTESKEAELLQDDNVDVSFQKEQFPEDGGLATVENASDQIISTDKTEEKVLEGHKQETVDEDDKTEEDKAKKKIQHEDSDGAEIQAVSEDETIAAEVIAEESQDTSPIGEESKKRETQGDKTTQSEPAKELEGAVEDGASAAQPFLGQNQEDQLHVTTSTLPSEEQKDEKMETELQGDETSGKSLLIETEDLEIKETLVKAIEETCHEENQCEKTNEGNENILTEVSKEEVFEKNQDTQTSSTSLSKELENGSEREELKDEVVEEKLVVIPQEPNENEITEVKIVCDDKTVEDPGQGSDAGKETTTSQKESIIELPPAEGNEMIHQPEETTSVVEQTLLADKPEEGTTSSVLLSKEQDEETISIVEKAKEEKVNEAEIPAENKVSEDISDAKKTEETCLEKEESTEIEDKNTASQTLPVEEPKEQSLTSSALPTENVEHGTTANVHKVKEEKVKEEDILENENEIPQEPEAVVDQETAVDHTSVAEKASSIEIISTVEKQDDDKLENESVEGLSVKKTEASGFAVQTDECESTYTAEKTERKEAELLQGDNETSAKDEKASAEIISTQKIEENVSEEHKQETVNEDNQEEETKKEYSDGAKTIQEKCSEKNERREFQALLEDGTIASEVIVEESQEHMISREAENEGGENLEGEKSAQSGPARELEGASEDEAPATQTLLEVRPEVTSTLPSGEQKDETKETKLQEYENTEKIPEQTSVKTENSEKVLLAETEDIAVKENQREKTNEGVESIPTEVSMEEVLEANQFTQTSSTSLSEEPNNRSGRDELKDELVEEGLVENEILEKKIVSEDKKVEYPNQASGARKETTILTKEEPSIELPEAEGNKIIDQPEEESATQIPREINPTDITERVSSSGEKDTLSDLRERVAESSQVAEQVDAKEIDSKVEQVEHEGDKTTDNGEEIANVSTSVEDLTKALSAPDHVESTKKEILEIAAPDIIEEREAENETGDAQEESPAQESNAVQPSATELMETEVSETPVSHSEDVRKEDEDIGYKPEQALTATSYETQTEEKCSETNETREFQEDEPIVNELAEEKSISREEESMKGETQEGDKSAESARGLEGAPEDEARVAQSVLGENQGDQLHVTASTLPSEEQKDETESLEDENTEKIPEQTREVEEASSVKTETIEKGLLTETEDLAIKENLTKAREETRDEKNQCEETSEGNKSIQTEVSKEKVLEENQDAQTSSATSTSEEPKNGSARDELNDELVEEKLVIKPQEPSDIEIDEQKIVGEDKTVEDPSQVSDARKESTTLAKEESSIELPEAESYEIIDQSEKESAMQSPREFNHIEITKAMSSNEEKLTLADWQERVAESSHEAEGADAKETDTKVEVVEYEGEKTIFKGEEIIKESVPEEDLINVSSPDHVESSKKETSDMAAEDTAGNREAKNETGAAQKILEKKPEEEFSAQEINIAQPATTELNENELSEAPISQSEHAHKEDEDNIEGNTEQTLKASVYETQTEEVSIPAEQLLVETQKYEKEVVDDGKTTVRDLEQASVGMKDAIAIKEEILGAAHPIESTIASSTGVEHFQKEMQGIALETSHKAEVRDSHPGNTQEVHSEAGVDHGEENEASNSGAEIIKEPVSKDSAKLSLSDILQGSTGEKVQVAKDAIEDREIIVNKEKPRVAEAEAEEKTDEEKEEGEGDEQKTDFGSETLVMVEAPRDADTKPHKKSHNILSGVGSKVKHSISKVKKAITGKSSHSKEAKPKSPKGGEKS